MSFKFSPVPRFKIIGFPMKSICCVPCLGSSNEVRQTLSSSPSHRALSISHRVKIITVSLRERFPGFPGSGPPISTAMLAPRALPFFLEGPRFDLWENSWQIAMSILMDDIIWTILLITYDYLFLFSPVAIDPQLQQLKKEKKNSNCLFLERSPSRKGSGLLFPWILQVMFKPFTKSSYRRYLRWCKGRLLEVGKTGMVLPVWKMRKWNSDRLSALPSHTASQNQGFKSWSFRLESKCSLLFPLPLSGTWRYI